MYDRRLAAIHRCLRGQQAHLPSSNRASPSAHQVDDQNYQSYNQKQVDQASTDMQSEAQKPQNQKNDQNGPKHGDLQCSFASN
jgi:hypothetical protein